MSSAASSILRALLDDRSLPPHLLLVVAHPDDEVIGAGGLLRRLARRGAAIELLHATDGSPRDLRDARANGFSGRAAYADARRGELGRALQAGGVVPLRFHTLDVVDQEAATRLPAIARQLADVFVRVGPDAVMTHPYEGGHPDHDALAFAVWAATRLMPDPPAVLELTSYHAGPSGLCAGRFLPVERWPSRPVTLKLTDREREAKSAMLGCFVTQRETMRWFPVVPERFRDQPAYDFGRPPHEGRLFYEYFGWGMTSSRWRGHVRDAVEVLGVVACR
ncbi:MAG TPA: PIG-L family deacetylase [Vicinamibacterales bacterium]|nr:PIG-L family deacetylase [Vicinamibacterales bacterium]